MPDEDPNIGSPPETVETPQESSQVATPAETSDQNSEAGEDTTPSSPVLNTVGEAIKQFERNRLESSSGYKPATTTAPVKVSRDYSGLEHEEQAWFKKMGDQAFNALKPKYLEYKQLKQDYEKLKTSSQETTKQSFFEHENAYQLTPEYQTASQNLSQLNAEATHWQKQLANIRGGQPWQPLVLDNKGNVVIGEPQDPSPDGEAVIMNALTQAHILKSDINNKLGGIQTSFKSNHQNFMQQLVAVDKKIFEGADQTALTKAMETKLPMFPQHLHGNPLVKSLAKSLAVIDGLVALLNDAKAAKTTQTLKAKTATNAGPSVENLQPASVKAGGKVSDVIKEFNDARMAGVA